MSEKGRIIDYVAEGLFWQSPPERHPDWGEIDDDEPSAPPQMQLPAAEGSAFLTDQPAPEDLRAE
jgi:hypothetical protein